MDRGIAEQAAFMFEMAVCEHMARKPLDTATRNTLLLAPAGSTRQGLPPGEGPSFVQPALPNRELPSSELFPDKETEPPAPSGAGGACVPAGYLIITCYWKSMSIC